MDIGHARFVVQVINKIIQQPFILAEQDLTAFHVESMEIFLIWSLIWKIYLMTGKSIITGQSKSCVLI